MEGNVPFFGSLAELCLTVQWAKLEVQSTVCKNELPHGKTIKMACAPSEDSDQPGHPPSLISEDSDQPGHLPSLIRVFAVCIKKAWVLSYPLSAQWRLWSDWADAQADLSLRWAYMPICWFCHNAAQSLAMPTRKSSRGKNDQNEKILNCSFRHCWQTEKLCSMCLLHNIYQILWKAVPVKIYWIIHMLSNSEEHKNLQTWKHKLAMAVNNSCKLGETYQQIV